MRARSAALCLLVASSPGLARADGKRPRACIVPKAAITHDRWVISGTVFVDGVERRILTQRDGAWEGAPVTVDPGRHVVRIELDDGRVQEQAVDVAAGRRCKDVVVRIRGRAWALTSPIGKAAWAFVPLAFGVAATGGGIAAEVYAVVEHSKTVTLQNAANKQVPGSCPAPSVSSTSTDCSKAGKQASRAANAAIGGAVALGVGAALVSLGIIAFILSLKAEHEAQTAAWSITPLLSPQLAGLGFVARF